MPLWHGPLCINLFSFYFLFPIPCSRNSLVQHAGVRRGCCASTVSFTGVNIYLSRIECQHSSARFGRGSTRQFPLDAWGIWSRSAIGLPAGEMDFKSESIKLRYDTEVLSMRIYFETYSFSNYEAWNWTIRPKSHLSWIPRIENEKILIPSFVLNQPLNEICFNKELKLASQWSLCFGTGTL